MKKTIDLIKHHFTEVTITGSFIVWGLIIWWIFKNFDVIPDRLEEWFRTFWGMFY